MPDAHLLRLAALSLLDGVFRELRDLPRELDTRAGILRVRGEPVVIPRDWLRRDPQGRCIERAIREGWHAATDTPFSLHVGTHGYCLHAWHLAFNTTWLSEQDGTATFIEGFEGNPPFAMQRRHSMFPDLWAMLPEVFHGILWHAFSRFSQTPDEDDPVTDEFFAEDLSQALCHEVYTRIDRETFLDAVRVLAWEDDLAVEHERPALPATSRVVRTAELLVAGVVVAQQNWHPNDRHLSALLPWAVCAGHAPTLAGVTGWLRTNGLSRKALNRLPQLPAPALDEVVREWLPNARTDWRLPVAWLGTLLSLLYRRRERGLDEVRVRLLARITAVAGLSGAGPSTGGGPRRHERHPGYALAQDDQHIVADAAVQMVGTLTVNSTEAGAALARTLCETLLDADAQRYAHIRDTIGDVCDWILGDDFLMGEARNLAPEDVGPDWETLMRNQHAWHERWAHLQDGVAPARSRAAEPPDPPLTWTSPCGAFTVGEHRVVPLVSSSDLWDEGCALGHCVATYTERCLHGTSRLFSVRSAADGARLGTAEFSPRGDNWRLVQFRGHINRQLLTGAMEPVEPFRAVIDSLRARLAATRRVA